jgi:hypothetical protein
MGKRVGRQLADKQLSIGQQLVVDARATPASRRAARGQRRALGTWQLNLKTGPVSQPQHVPSR